MIFKNFKSYTPDTEDKKALVAVGVLFASDENGRDWYDCLSDFPEETYKVIFDPDGKVFAYTKVASNLPMIPNGYSVADVHYLPVDFKADGTFVYNEDLEEVVARKYTPEEIQVKVESKKTSLIEETLTLINPLQFAVDLEMATEEERSRLKSLQKYVVLLNRVPLQDTYPTGVVWPEIPTT